MPALITERRIISFVILVLTTGLFVSTFGLEFAALGGAFSPMFFPRLILMVLLGLAILNFGIDFLRSEQRQPIQFWPVAIISVAFVVYVVSLQPLGYFLASAAMGIVTLLTLGLRNPVQVLAVPVITAGGLVGLFNHILKMPLPTSPFFWWI